MSKAFDKATRIQICTLCMTIGLANLGEYMITLGLVYHLSTKFGLNSFLIGIGSSCLTTGYLLSLYLFQKVLVKLKPGRVILTAVISMSTMTIVMALAESYIVFFVFGKVKWWKLSGIFVIIPQFAIMLLFLYAKSAVTYQSLIIFNLIYGVIFSYTYTQNLFTTTCGTAHKARRVMTYQFWLTLGSTMGSMLGGLLYKNYGWSSMMNTFFFAYLLIFIIEIAIYFVIKKRGNREVISYYNPN